MPTLVLDEDAKYGSDAWKKKMSENGNILKTNNVKLIVLVHGTFAGNDALGLFSLLDPINKKLADTLRNKGRTLIDGLAKDVGNYTTEYTEELGNNLDIACNRFTWSSGNNHHARLKGVVKLAEELANQIFEIKIKPNKRILLYGHSHAGQLFALLTTFLADDDRTQRLYEIMEKYEELEEDKNKLASSLEKIKTINLDFVTFGTPVRYVWGDYEKAELMAIVNHREKVRICGVLSTRDGDYVQQWGAEGSDIKPTFDKIIPNDELDEILDKGRDVSLLIANLKREDRRHPRESSGQIVSDTFFVDYKDNAPFPIYFLNPFNIPHCIKTLFGHGVYTRYYTMLFNLNIIVKKLYSKSVKQDDITVKKES